MLKIECNCGINLYDHGKIIWQCFKIRSQRYLNVPVLLFKLDIRIHTTPVTLLLNDVLQKLRVGGWTEVRVNSNVIFHS